MDKAEVDRSSFFVHTDPNTGEPVIQPFQCLRDIDRWIPGSDVLCVANADLHTDVAKSLSTQTRTLVCHDMKGGYLDDRFVQGVSATDCYRFYNWSKIDIFVYFSHYFITLPPPCWTNAAHRNGVPVLGTVITEWESGKEICEEFLKTVDSRRQFVDQLVAVAQYYRFDGWLINIENEIKEDDVPKLVEFVRELTEAMKTALPVSLVIWYDSVVLSGKLEWQNELNAKNSTFFDVSDGIFLNYTWKEGNLERSKQAAGDRFPDVYVGVDVFGRGCKGGGGFNTVEAVRDARERDLSVAIFGQGWAYEKFGNADFLENEKRFWELLSVCCTTRKLTGLPLLTTFCQGWGLKFHQHGQSLNDDPWMNMSLQQLQPTTPQIGVAYDQTMVLSGGGSMRFTCTETLKPINRFDLFDTDICIPQGSDIIVSYTYHSHTASELALDLVVASSNLHHLILPGSDSHDVIKGNISTDHKIIPSSNYQDIDTSHLLCNRDAETNGWQTSWFRWKPITNQRLHSVALLLECGGPDSTPNSACLGSLRIIPAECIKLPEISSFRAVDVCCSSDKRLDNTEFEASMTLVWTCNAEVEYFVVYHEVEDKWECIGRASATAFRICDLMCRKAMCTLKVQAVYCAGACVPLIDSPVVSVLCQPEEVDSTDVI